MEKALFLDRDGVINEDLGYVWRVDDFRFIDGIFDLCRAARDMGFLRIVVTNQAGIARGFYDESQFHSLTNWMKQEFSAREASIDAVYFCPFHPTAGLGRYRRNSDWRKPAPGMLLQATRDFSLDLTASALIGNAATDIEAGRAAGVGLNMLHDPAGIQSDDGGHVVCRNLVEAKVALTEFAGMQAPPDRRGAAG